MRIVGGVYKGRVLERFNVEEIRPTSDMVRESLFNILRDKIPGSVFLDAFCGTGAVGIEAASRGAQRVTLTEVSRNAFKVAEKNLAKLKTENVLLKNCDAVSFMKNNPDAFDVIYLDPPYKAGLKDAAITAATTAVRDDGIIVFEDEKPCAEEYDGLIKYDERRYGRAFLTFFKKAAE